MLPQHPHRFVDLPTPSSSEQLIPSQQSSSSLDKKNHDPPVSPTALYQHMITSGTLDNKSPEELRSLVQEAYTTLRAKEKDIKLAAEVGWALLENNLELKARHETLEKSLHVSRTSSPELDMKPSTSILTRSNNTHATASRILQRVDSSDSQQSNDTNSTMRLISKEQADEAIVRMLTEKNAEIQHILDTTLARHEAARQADLERTQRLEQEMNQLQTRLDQAAQTIERLEKSKSETLQQQAATAAAAEESVCSSYDDHMLTTRLAQLQQEHERLLAGKATTQSKLDKATWDLEQWQKQIANLEIIDQKYKVQQMAFAQQARDIARLTGTLEDYRTQMTQVDTTSNKSSRSNHSRLYLDNDTQFTYSSDKLKQPATMTPSKSNQTTSLLCELERTWAKERRTRAAPPPPLTLVSSNHYRRRASSNVTDSATTNKKSSVQELQPISATSPVHMLYESPTSTSNGDGSHISLSSSSSSSEGGMLLPSPSTYSSLSSRKYARSLHPSPSSIVAGFEDGSCTIPPSLYANLSACCSRRPLIPSPPIRRFRRRSVVPPSSSSNSLCSILLWFPLLMIHKIWAWYKFSLILFLAVLINLWQGPDAILEK
ncbi:hypothetical protein LRAMOSA04480 [Lichtheimia ramosa]|uniref:Uncharacterized protein n=1 Tax=Lichtheimia ramosa TaxID=688394 RepID=A0A077WYD3_9FUNG|nr:hypothetical protein LRAMOSA04480 [Lichtheimia ramosa]